MVLYLLNLIDLATTLYALSWGAVEMNPIMALSLSIHPAVFAALKLSVLPLCLWLERKSQAYPYLIGVFGATVWWNIVNIIYLGGM